MKWLIVNADDFGISSKRNAGIVEAHLKGIVTSASILVYAPAFREALKYLKACPSLEVGLHLNLSEGEPVALGHKSLVGPDGNFWGKEEARRRAKENLFNLGEVEKETEAQLDVLRQAGVRITHLNGHQHLHVFGSLPDPIARAASRLGIRCFRSPAETLRLPIEVSRDRTSQVEEYRVAAHRATGVFAGYRMRSTEHFAGVGLSGHLTTENLMTALGQLPEGLTELMVHPGYPDASEGFTGPDRETELRALTDPRVRQTIQREKIELTGFGKL